MQIVIQTLIRRVLAHKPLTLVSGGWLMRQLAVAVTVAKVKNNPNHKPDAGANEGLNRQEGDHNQAGDPRQNW